MIQRLRRAMATRCASNSASVRVIDLPHAGHFLLLEQPEAVTRAVTEFVGTGPAGELDRLPASPAVLKGGH